MEEEGKPKYLSRGPLNTCLYGLEKCSQSRPVVVVEGFLDQWRIGWPSVCSFGKKLSSTQISLLFQLNPSKVILAWDSDAFWEQFQTERRITSLGIECTSLRFPPGEDPDSLGRGGLLSLYKEKGGKSNDLVRCSDTEKDLRTS